MRVLVLSPQADLLIPTIEASGDEAIIPNPKMPKTARDIMPGAWDCLPEEWPAADFVVSFNYKHIIKGEVLEKYKGRIINIHTSVLPFNRGAHPNFWSWFDATPKGVSIHRVDEGIDTGELLASIEILECNFGLVPTLKSTYTHLIIAAAGLFRERWVEGGKIRNRFDLSRWQDSKPSFHLKKDIDPFFSKLPSGWNSYVSDVKRMGEFYRGTVWQELK